MMLQERIHKLTNGSFPAFSSLAEVASFLHSNYRMQKILKAEVSPPKLAKATLKSGRNGAEAQKAAFLTSNASRTPFRSIQASVLGSSTHKGEVRADMSSRANQSGYKENESDVREVTVARSLESDFPHSLNDIPIGRWREHGLRTRMGSPPSCPARSAHSAAKSLLGLSQLR